MRGLRNLLFVTCSPLVRKVIRTNDACAPGCIPG
jgi:hypothetical protein